MLENWLSSSRPPELKHWLKDWLLVLTGISSLSGGGCTRTETAIPKCVEGVLTAENHANCTIKRYQEFASNPQEFNRRKKSARQLYAQGEADFAAGLYKRAYIAYSTSAVWVPSYRTMVKTGDAIFYRHASDMETEGPDGGKRACSNYFVREAELQIPQTYDAALRFQEFESNQTELKVSQEELEQVRHKSACLKELASTYRDVPDACVDRESIRQCLTQAN